MSTAALQPRHHGLPRHGLAPLEFVLALPILLFVMALMVNFGTAASWKIRGLGAVRYSLWANRWPRSTASFPALTYWPGNTGVGAVDANLGENLVPPSVDGTPGLGPSGYVAPNTGNPTTDVMNFELGFTQGSANLTRQFPLFTNLPPYRLTAQTDLLDNKWEFERMQWLHVYADSSEHPRYLQSNMDLRVPVVYIMYPGVNQGAWAKAYSEARQTIIDLIQPFAIPPNPVANPNAAEPPLWALYPDAEFKYYGSLGLSPQTGNLPYDWEPTLGSNIICGDDTSVRAAIDNLIDRIQGNAQQGVHDVAWTMAKGFIQLYQYVINNYQLVTGTALPPQLQQTLQQDINILTLSLPTL